MAPKPVLTYKNYIKKWDFRLLKCDYFQANDLEETIKRIQSHKGVVGMMIVNNDGKHFCFATSASFHQFPVPNF